MSPSPAWDSCWEYHHLSPCIMYCIIVSPYHHQRQAHPSARLISWASRCLSIFTCYCLLLSSPSTTMHAQRQAQHEPHAGLFPFISFIVSPHYEPHAVRPYMHAYHIFILLLYCLIHHHVTHVGIYYFYFIIAHLLQLVSINRECRYMLNIIHACMHIIY